VRAVVGFVVRRLVGSALVLLVTTALMFVLVSHAGDPFADLHTRTGPEREAAVADRSRQLHLDRPVPVRYLLWVGQVAGCVVPGHGCDLGRTLHEQDVAVLLGQAIGSTAVLVGTALVLAILLGVGLGTVSALRQYSVFDHTMTLSTFVLLSLPVFWVAVLLKQYAAIGFNDWYADPRVSPVVAVAISVPVGLLAGVLVRDGRLRWMVRIGVAVGVFAFCEYLSVVGWFARPALGPFPIAVASFALALSAAAVTTGGRRDGVLRSVLLIAAIGAIGQFFLTDLLMTPGWASYSGLAALAATAVSVAVLVAVAAGGSRRAAAVRAGVVTSLAIGSLLVLDVLLRSVPGYARLVDGRLLPTAGARTPNLDGTFWQDQLDLLTHLLLPVATIMLVGFVGYLRYARTLVLEVREQDFIRTARAAGLGERAVLVRHVLRNALVPLTTVAAIDLGVLVGGAVITEWVFARPGMGTLFISGLGPPPDPNLVMGFFLVVAVSVVGFNLLADLVHAWFDPRVRLR
jgi:peptide/nickel transport system permease protein